MEKWMILLAASLSTAIVIVCILCMMACYRHLHLRSKSNSQETLDEARNRYYAGLQTLRETCTCPNPSQKNKVASVWRNSCSYRHHYPLRVFEWNEHPSLVSEVVEYGWVTFGFTKTFVNSSPGSTCGIYNRFSHEAEGVEPEIGWEMGPGVDYMQKIRLNPGLQSKKDTNVLLPVQSVQSALPLPGPPLGTLSFPQEAYFEITILTENGEHVGSLGSSRRSREDEDIQLISNSINSENHLQHTNLEKTPTNFNGSYKGHFQGKKNSRRDSKCVDFGYMDALLRLNSMDPSSIPEVLSLGLAVGGAALYRLPGCERGSVGFHSTGFVFLNGMVYLGNEEDQHKPAFTKRSWDGVNTVIGCGYDPVKRRVFYTLNGDQVYSLICNSDEFSHPLYPTIAANYDVTVLVNFGQSQFEYLPANEQRVADPCFKRSLLTSPVKPPVLSHYEDSGDLFSMRMDSPWIGNFGYSNSQDLQMKHPPSEGESDLFEIPLDNK